MKDTEAFEELYLSTRDRLLVQAYALTGDLTAARAGVRHAFVAAAHHWPKVSQLADKEAWLRPEVWSYAQRRQTTKRKDQATEPLVKIQLESFAKLSPQRRKLLVLALLTTSSDAAIAAEVGLEQRHALDELAAAIDEHGQRIGVASEKLAHSLEPLAEAAVNTRWPRPHALRRTGTTRRRVLTGIGVIAALGAFAGAGWAVASPDGIQPSLKQHQVVPTTPQAPRALAPRLREAQLLQAPQVARVSPKLDWEAKPLSANTEDNEKPRLCQPERFADPDGLAGLVRDYRVVTDDPAKAALAAEQIELSRNLTEAKKAFATAQGWFAACSVPRAQLARTYSVEGVGDQANLFVYTLWEQNATMVLGVARSGAMTVSTWVVLPLPSSLKINEQGQLLAAAINRLCGLPGSGECAAPPKLERTSPLPIETAAGLLDQVDLPPVSNVKAPWVGTDPKPAEQNLAAPAGCARADFALDAMNNNLTRTFVIPQSKLPAAFGLTQSVARMPNEATADQFLTDVRERIQACSAKNLGTTANLVLQESKGPDELYSYRVTTEISIDNEISYFMALSRNGSAVSQLGFFAVQGAEMKSGDFDELARRAQARLASLPESASASK
jgi:DNA-directed RNA polymerase specialized sigma24 family protein